MPAILSPTRLLLTEPHRGKYLRFTRLILIVFPLDIVGVGKKVVPLVIASRRNTEADSGLDGTGTAPHSYEF